MSRKLEYKVDDRSLFLPYYRRYLVDPLLPFIPASVTPNSITHLGHLLNLAAGIVLVAFYRDRGVTLILAAVLVQLYLWCDNADGAHARRTNQCSPLGEFLDHGLDQLNTAYIGYMTAVSIGLPPLGWVAMAFLIPAAGSITYWEQSMTGVFRMGLINQIESLLVLCTALTISAIFGNGFWSDVELFGVSLRSGMLLWVTASIVFGMARGMYRVAKARGVAAVTSSLGLVFFGAVSFLAAWLDAISPVSAMILCSGSTVYCGLRMLTHRLHGETPRVGPVFVLGTAVLAALVAARLAGFGVHPMAGPAFATIACGVFGLHMVSDMRRSMVTLEAISAR